MAAEEGVLDGRVYQELGERHSIRLFSPKGGEKAVDVRPTIFHVVFSPSGGMAAAHGEQPAESLD
jgi:hypothetical protein